MREKQFNIQHEWFEKNQSQNVLQINEILIFIECTQLP